jgi:hypothetical protein
MSRHSLTGGTAGVPVLAALATLALLSSPAHAQDPTDVMLGARERTTRFATVTLGTAAEYGDYPRALEIFEQAVAAADDAFLAICNEFGPLEPYGCDDDRYNVPIRIVDYIDGPVARARGRTNSGVWVSETGGFNLGVVHAEAVEGAVNVRSTVAHEMMHVILHSYLGYPRAVNYWLLEGVGDLAEHLVWDEGPFKMSRFQNYLRTSEAESGRSGHNTGLLTSGLPHQNSLFFYYVWNTRGQTSLLRDLIRLHGEGHWDEWIVRELDLESYWEDFTKHAWNFWGIERMTIAGREITNTYGQLITPYLEESDRPVLAGPRQFRVPPMAWDDALFKVPAQTNVRFAIEPGLRWDNGVVHAYIHHWDEAVSRDEWVYANWSDREEVLVCQVESEECDAAAIDGPVAQVFVIVANTSSLTAIGDAIEATPIWPRKLRAASVQVSANRTLPVQGELIVDMTTDGAVRVSSEGWWLPVPLDLMFGPDAIVMDQAINGLVNNNCTFRGDVAFDVEERSFEVAAGGGQPQMRLELRRRGDPGFHSSPEGFLCVRPTNAAIQDAYPDLPMLPMVVERVDEMFEGLNHQEAAPGALLDTFANIMGGTMLLMVPDGESGAALFTIDSTESGANGPVYLDLGTTGIRVLFEPVPEQE